MSQGEMSHPATHDGAAAALRPYRQDVAGCLDARIGPHGLTASQLAAAVDAAGPALERLRAAHANRALALLTLPERTDDIAPAEAAIARLSEGADTIIFLGTGGSALGGQTLAQFSGWNIPGFVEREQRHRPRTRFYDNLDPMTLERSLASLDPATTRFVITSKSGNTPETLVQAIAALSRLEQAGLASRLPEMVLGLTEAAVPGRANGLRTILENRAIPVLEHDPGVGGRFSVLTNVGLLPAIARGLDVRALRAGAKTVLEATLASTREHPAPVVLGAALVIALGREKGIIAQAMMPYADRLGRLGDWFAQLWAESLGKNGHGSYPIACLGPVDQHSQLQLFMDGPRTHLMTMLRLPQSGLGTRIDAALAREAGLHEIAGRTVGDLVTAQAHGVPEALAQAGRPVRMFDIERLDAHAMGALLMHFMLETIIAGWMLGIDPFDQPAVELGKQLTRKRLLADAATSGTST